MMITSTADFAGRAISVGLDSDDARALMGAESWEAMTVQEQIDWLSKRVDIEVLIYLYKEKHITSEYLQERVKEIKAR